MIKTKLPYEVSYTKLIIAQYVAIGWICYSAFNVNGTGVIGGLVFLAALAVLTKEA